MPLKLLRACISLKATLQERLLAANSYKKKCKEDWAVENDMLLFLRTGN